MSDQSSQAQPWAQLPKPQLGQSFVHQGESASQIDLTEELQAHEILQRRTSKRRRGPLARVLIELRNHFVATITLTALGIILHYILRDWVGDPKFFDLVPYRYAFDAGDIAVIATFFINAVRKLLKIGQR